MKNLKEKQAESLNKSQGTGYYLYKNTTNKDIGLPKRSSDGKSLIPPGGFFRGDSYFLDNMRGQIAIMEDLSNTVRNAQQVLNEVPPAYTTKGAVDNKVENESVKSNEEILLLEEPCGTVTILE